MSRRAQLHADGGSWWDDLHLAYADFKRINHKEAYYTPDSHTNNAENFFSVLRRAERGTYHHIAHPTYFPAYCEESAWRQNHRNRDLGSRYDILFEAAVNADRSRLAGYYQRRKGYRSGANA